MFKSEVTNMRLSQLFSITNHQFYTLMNLEFFNEIEQKK
jgi:hypothetical protein